MTTYSMLHFNSYSDASLLQHWQHQQKLFQKMWVRTLPLTIGAAEDLHSQSYLPTDIPLQRDEAQESGFHGVQELVVNHTVSIAVPCENLEQQKSLVSTEFRIKDVNCHSLPWFLFLQIT